MENSSNGEFVETARVVVVSNENNFRNKTICIGISMSISCMMLVISIPILIAHTTSMITAEILVKNSTYILNQTSNTDVPSKPEIQDNLRPVPGSLRPVPSGISTDDKPTTDRPTYRPRNDPQVKLVSEEDIDCKCRAPFYPASNCSLCYYSRVLKIDKPKNSTKKWPYKYCQFKNLTHFKGFMAQKRFNLKCVSF